MTTIDSFLDDVVLRADTDPIKHMRLEAIQGSCPLVGAEIIGTWRTRADRYPDELVTAMVERSLTSEVLAGWSARYALAERGDDVAIHALLVRIERAVLGAILAINRVYVPHRLVMWQRHLTAGLEQCPEGLSDQIHGLWAPRTADALNQAEELLIETVQLAAATSGA